MIVAAFIIYWLLYIFVAGFRHYANRVNVFALKCLIRFVNFIDRKTCPEYHYVAEPKAQKAETKPQTENSTKPCKEVNIKNPDGKITLAYENDSQLQAWLKQNPDLSIE